MVSTAPEQIRPLRRVEYDHLVALGTFDGERIELIDGALRRMSPIGPPHTSTVDLLNELLVLALVGRARVRVQGSFAASELSEPEPDFCILPGDTIGASDPRTSSSRWQTHLRYDRGEEPALCSVRRPEYWVAIARACRRGVSRARPGGYRELTTVRRERDSSSSFFPTSNSQSTTSYADWAPLRLSDEGFAFVIVAEPRARVTTWPALQDRPQRDGCIPVL